MASEFHVTGIIQNGAIQLDQPLELSDGQRVVVAVSAVTTRSRGDGIRASAGAWADAGPEFDRWLAEVYESRRMVRGNLGE
jgi:hypothetical protein